MGNDRLRVGSIGFHSSHPQGHKPENHEFWPDGKPTWRAVQVSGVDRLRVGWLNGFPYRASRGQKMLKGHLPRVIYHQMYFSIPKLNLRFLALGRFS